MLWLGTPAFAKKVYPPLFQVLPLLVTKNHGHTTNKHREPLKGRENRWSAQGLQDLRNELMASSLLFLLPPSHMHRTEHCIHSTWNFSCTDTKSPGGKCFPLAKESKLNIFLTVIVLLNKILTRKQPLLNRRKSSRSRVRQIFLRLDTHTKTQSKNGGKVIHGL